MFCTVEVISPEYAQLILSSNDGNRKLRRSWVEDLSGRMSRGEWKVTHQGIAIDEKGNLIDGQHRLAAVVKHGNPVSMAVFRGIASDTFEVLDDGVKRSVTDHIGGNNRVNDCCSFVLHFIGQRRPTATEVKRLIQTPVGDAISFVVKESPTVRRGVSSSPVLASAAFNYLYGQSESERQYPVKMFKAMSLADYDGMSKVAKAFYKQASDDRSIHSGDPEFLVKAWYALDIVNENVSKFAIKDFDGRRKQIREAFKNAINYY